MARLLVWDARHDVVTDPQSNRPGVLTRGFQTEFCHHERAPLSYERPRDVLVEHRARCSTSRQPRLGVWRQRRPLTRERGGIACSPSRELHRVESTTSTAGSVGNLLAPGASTACGSERSIRPISEEPSKAASSWSASAFSSDLSERSRLQIDGGSGDVSGIGEALDDDAAGGVGADPVSVHGLAQVTRKTPGCFLRSSCSPTASPVAGVRSMKKRLRGVQHANSSPSSHFGGNSRRFRCSRTRRCHECRERHDSPDSPPQRERRHTDLDSHRP